MVGLEKTPQAKVRTPAGSKQQETPRKTAQSRTFQRKVTLSSGRAQGAALDAKRATVKEPEAQEAQTLLKDRKPALTPEGKQAPLARAEEFDEVAVSDETGKAPELESQYLTNPAKPDLDADTADYLHPAGQDDYLKPAAEEDYLKPTDEADYLEPTAESGYVEPSDENIYEEISDYQQLAKDEGDYSEIKDDGYEQLPPTSDHEDDYLAPESASSDYLEPSEGTDKKVSDDYLEPTSDEYDDIIEKPRQAEESSSEVKTLFAKDEAAEEEPIYESIDDLKLPTRSKKQEQGTIGKAKASGRKAVKQGKDQLKKLFKA